MSIAVLAEKPSVARDLARSLGADRRGEGYLHGAGYVVTWCIGHLVRLAEPHEVNPAWKRWSLAALPMLPERWPLVAYENTKPQLEVVRRILTSPKVTELVCATDAGREGELIFRYVYELVGCDKPWKRLWLSSLTDTAIRGAFDRLRDGRALDPLADAARGRSRADWLVGMNLSRAYSLAHDDELSVGRVQTPTLAMLVDREQEIRAFVPEPYIEVHATFSRRDEAEPTWRATYFSPSPGQTKSPTPEQRRLPADGARAAEIVARATAGVAVVESVAHEEKRLPPPQLYDLTELQRHANRLYGLSAQQTLDAAQALYETHKLLSYPRTDSRHLSRDVAATLGAVVAAVAPRYADKVAAGSGERPLSGRFVDDAKVTDHHAIIPTSTRADGARLSDAEGKVYDLVCRRLLCAWHADHRWGATQVITRIDHEAERDRYHASGTSVVDVGWKLLDLGKPDRELSLPTLSSGEGAAVCGARPVSKTTEPPRRYTEATLLTAMETAGRTLDEKELSLAMRDTGLGTPATRASVLETLFTRGYAARDGRSLAPTDKGMRLVSLVHAHVKSPAMTGEWEAKLARIGRGEGALSEFVAGVEAYVREVVAGVAPAAKAQRPARAPRPTDTSPTKHVTAARAAAEGPDSDPPGGFDDAYFDSLPEGPGEPGEDGEARHADVTERPAERPAPAPPVRRATSSRDLDELLQTRFGHPAFRRHQREVCEAVVAGHDALLVMPTGAGKSLCYQLPGLARGGTTLVISPLIALMEDQVAKLQAAGLAAERVHGGRARDDARRTLSRYLRGELEFLFVAPERLALRGFLDALASRPPTLVAVDEAHCISQWGHDFRPEYRMLGQRLPELRPAPILALTATATPAVQEDIVQQLGVPGAARFIHGFRRTNLAIECAEVFAKDRPAAMRALLRLPGRLPAIVYAPTRKESVRVAEELAKTARVRPYHAGMPAAERERVQGDFLSGRLDVVVATIAFGMGIDKADVRTVVHCALPSTIEGYYQEIGRAGRDGQESRAVMLFGFADRKTHEFFLDRDYPPPTAMRALYSQLPRRARPRSDVLGDLEAIDGIDDDFARERALSKLWVHGGALLDEDDNVSIGPDAWEAPYTEVRRHRQAELAKIARYAERPGCRMLALLDHFGDLEDTTPCGRCDACAPAAALVRTFELPSASEGDAIGCALGALARVGGSTTTGKLHKEAFPDDALSRREFERLVDGLARSRLVTIEDDEFEKDGQTIRFRRVRLTPEGEQASPELLRAVKLAPRLERGKKRRGRGAPSPLTKNVVKRARRAPAEDDKLGVALRELRLSEAKRRKVPAFRVFPDSTLMAIVDARPKTLEELTRVPGVGPTVLANYGDKILAAVKRS
ncbi:MAG: DNA topoisomerase 3 [Polyangiaceae bacterium]|nr:DNA topoisomerase 3 [Polyangiaceae bacterium]